MLEVCFIIFFSYGGGSIRISGDKKFDFNEENF